MPESNSMCTFPRFLVGFMNGVPRTVARDFRQESKHSPDEFIHVVLVNAVIRASTDRKTTES